jgi:heme-degrading monooxygenase HmoA
MIKVPAAHLNEFTTKFIKRRIIEECEETVPGFLHGDLMTTAEKDGQICVMCKWTGQDAYDQWAASPIRAKQNEDILDFLSKAGFEADDVHTLMFEGVHSVAGSAF